MLNRDLREDKWKVSMDTATEVSMGATEVSMEVVGAEGDRR